MIAKSCVALCPKVALLQGLNPVGMDICNSKVFFCNFFCFNFWLTSLNPFKKAFFSHDHFKPTYHNNRWLKFTPLVRHPRTSTSASSSRYLFRITKRPVCLKEYHDSLQEPSLPSAKVNQPCMITTAVLPSFHKFHPPPVYNSTQLSTEN